MTSCTGSMPYISHNSSSSNIPRVCSLCMESGGSPCQTCSGREGHALPLFEVCHEGSRSVLHLPTSVPLAPANAPPQRQSSPLLSHVRHIQPRNVYLSVDPELGLFAWQSSEMVRPCMSLIRSHFYRFLQMPIQNCCYRLAGMSCQDPAKP